jgi:hypothetical protein
MVGACVLGRASGGGLIGRGQPWLRTLQWLVS